MAKAFALKFKPPGDGHFVPAEGYASTLRATVEGLDLLAKSSIAHLALKSEWHASEICSGLALSVGPTEQGSLVVPFAFGVGSISKQIANVFWQTACSALLAVSVGREPDFDVPGRCAERLATAAYLAHTECGGSQLELCEKSGRVWKPTLSLSDVEGGLREFAKQRSLKSSTHAQVLGKVDAIQHKARQVTVIGAGGARNMSFPADLRTDIHALWGKDAIFDVRAQLNADGELSEPRVISARPLSPPASGREAWTKLAGAMVDTFGTAEAQKYIRNLRKH